MIEHMADTGGSKSGLWRIAIWTAAASLLLIPAIAMRFTAEVNWTAADFVFAACLIGGVGLGIEFLISRSTDLAYRVASVLALLATFLTVWVNAAVGMIGSEDNPYNLVFLAVIAIAMLGALVARFRPGGMARATAAASVLQLLLAAGGLATDLRGAVFSIAFALPWMLSAVLYQQAAAK